MAGARRRRVPAVAPTEQTEQEPTREPYRAMMQRLKGEWEARQHGAALKEVLDEWACDPEMCFGKTLLATLGYTAAMAFRIMREAPELRAIYDEGMWIRKEVAKCTKFEEAVGAQSLSVGESISATFILRGYDRGDKPIGSLAERQELTGADGSPITVVMEKN